MLREVLEHGGSVDIDGLGTLSAGGKHGFRFVAQNKPRVFIAYVEEDLRVRQEALPGLRRRAAFAPGWTRSG